MHNRSERETYDTFIDFVGKDIQHERSNVNKRMFMVFIWCFVLPVFFSFSLLVLINTGALPKMARGYLDWVLLLFPVVYGCYFFSSEVLVHIPLALRRGGAVTTLNQFKQEAAWRERVCEEMKRIIGIKIKEWIWVCSNFEIDLKRMRQRTAYLTALAGAVFFLILQGIDALGDEPNHVSWVRAPWGWVEATSNDLYQFAGLVLFLVLFYLSGLQMYHSLARYLNCARMVCSSCGGMGGADDASTAINKCP
ncbi:MAG: hypothetical protein AABZ06_02505 [Bdellovibrionota bacterium]